MASALTLGEAIERIKGDLGIDDELKGARAPRAHAPTPRSWFHPCAPTWKKTLAASSCHRAAVTKLTLNWHMSADASLHACAGKAALAAAVEDLGACHPPSRVRASCLRHPVRVLADRTACRDRHQGHEGTNAQGRGAARLQ